MSGQKALRCPKEVSIMINSVDKDLVLQVIKEVLCQKNSILT
jgi:hypothetical protein